MRRILFVVICFHLFLGAGLRAGNPGLEDDGDVKEEDTEESEESEDNLGFIEINKQVFRESLPLAGAPYRLHYTSWRAAGNRAAYTLDIPLFQAPAPMTLENVSLTITVTNRVFSYHDEKPFGPNMYSWCWDGLDAASNTVEGMQTASREITTEEIIYVYETRMSETRSAARGAVGGGGPPPPPGGDGMGPLRGGEPPREKPIHGGDWEVDPIAGAANRDGQGEPGGGGGAPSSASVSMERVRVPRRYTSSRHKEYKVGVALASAQGLGGWTISAQHFYDSTGETLFRGDGRIRRIEPIGTPACVFVGDKKQTTATNAIEIISADGNENCNIKCRSKRNRSMLRTSVLENSTEDKKGRVTWNKAKVSEKDAKASI